MVCLCFKEKVLFFQTQPLWRIVCRLHTKRFTESHTGQKALLALISFLIHTSRHLAGSLLKLCLLQKRELQRQATYGTKTQQNLTRSGCGEKIKSFCVFSPQIKPLQDSLLPCGSDMRITSTQTCNACVIRQSDRVHTHGWRIKGSQGQISSPHVCAERPVQRTRVRPRIH